MMDSHLDQIKDITYQKLQSITAEVIERQFLCKKGAAVIEEISRHCQEALKGISVDADEGLGVFATVLLHYLCTNLLIPTQRKTTLDGIDIDMVVPDTRTLKTDCNSSLVLCILTSIKQPYIDKKIADAKKIQPNQENIWIVTPRPINTQHKTFVIDIKENTFSGIIDKMQEFLEKNQTTKFKIFKTV